MQTADRFGMPILTLVDTPGAYPGLGAEERGQAEAIAVNLREMSRLGVPIVTVVTGEGGSGGALAIAVADVVLMFENSICSVISPEGCASILWPTQEEPARRERSSSRPPTSAVAMSMDPARAGRRAHAIPRRRTAPGAGGFGHRTGERVGPEKLFERRSSSKRMASAGANGLTSKNG